MQISGNLLGLEPKHTTWASNALDPLLDEVLLHSC
jgi:hypothetical protein